MTWYNVVIRYYENGIVGNDPIDSPLFLVRGNSVYDPPGCPTGNLSQVLCPEESMKLKGHKPKSRWHSPTFTLSEIDRESLSIILIHAKEGIEASLRMYEDEGKTESVIYKSTVRYKIWVEKMLAYIDSESPETDHYKPLILSMLEGMTDVP